MLAAVAVPRTLVWVLRIAPLPMKPIPVTRPCLNRDSASVFIPNEARPAIKKPQVETATKVTVLSPALRSFLSRSQAIGRASKNDNPSCTRWETISPHPFQLIRSRFTAFKLHFCSGACRRFNPHLCFYAARDLEVPLLLGDSGIAADVFQDPGQSILFPMPMVSMTSRATCEHPQQQPPMKAKIRTIYPRQEARRASIPSFCLRLYFLYLMGSCHASRPRSLFLPEPMFEYSLLGRCSK